MRHVRDTWGDDASIDRQWRALNYTAAPDGARAVEEYEAFVECLRGDGASVDFIPPGDGAGLDAIYTRDAAIVCDEGMILCRMGKPARRGEPAAIEAFAREREIPVIGRIDGDGLLEGGDAAWIDERTLAVGRGDRTNGEGIRQLRRLMQGCVDEIIEVQLPAYRATGDVFHLMSIYSPVDSDLAVVFPPLMPDGFSILLRSRGVAFVEVPDSEFESMGCNVLATGPRRCIMIDGNPITRSRLERAGAEVRVISGREICRKGCGGPTCLTRPLSRERSPSGR